MFEPPSDVECHGNGATAEEAFGLHNATLVVDGSFNCTNNWARGFGDGVRGSAIGGEGSVIRVSGIASLDGNEANYGGGLSLTRSTLQVFNELRCAKNTASVNGGAMYLEVSTVRIDGLAYFSGNVAKEGGGAAFVGFESTVDVAGDATWIVNSAFVGGGVFTFISDFTVLVGGNATFTRNSASSGGGLTAFSSSVVSASGGATSTENVAIVGGAMVVREFSTLRLTGTGVTMSGNYATSYGGAMGCESITVLQVEGARYVSNSCGISGGAVSWVSAGTAKTIFCEGNPAIFANCSFAEYKANDSGGALYIAGGFANVTGTEFHNNTAGERALPLISVASHSTVLGWPFGILLRSHRRSPFLYLAIATSPLRVPGISEFQVAVRPGTIPNATTNALRSIRGAVSHLIMMYVFHGPRVCLAPSLQPPGRSGGAILVAGTVDLTDCTFRGNQADTGPAVSNTMTVTLSSTELISNTLTFEHDKST